jgi:uncharacterized protein
MSQANVEFVEGVLSGAAEMDKHALLAALPELIAQVADPDIEWVEEPQNVEGRVYRGHDGVKQSFERWLEQWDEFGYEAERFVDCGDDVLVVGREHGRGMTSGASVTSRHYSVWTIRAGKIARYREFYDEQTALKAAGLAG